MLRPETGGAFKCIRNFGPQGSPGEGGREADPLRSDRLLWLAHLFPGPLAFGRRRAITGTTPVFLRRCGATSVADTASPLHTSRALSSGPASRTTYSFPPTLLTHLPPFLGQGIPARRPEPLVGFPSGVHWRSAPALGEGVAPFPTPGQTGRPAGASAARKQGSPRATSSLLEQVRG